MEERTSKISKALAGSVAILTWLVLALQFYLQLTNTDVQNISTVERVIRFFSYFTTTTNLIVAITWTVSVFFPRTKPGEFFSKATTQTAVAVYISIVGAIYSLFLRNVWNPQGWQWFADHWLHDAVPLLFVSYWIFFLPKLGLSWREPVKWLIYPVIYIVYSLIRGAFADWYPYYFADVTQLGYPVALTNTAFVIIAFFVLGFIYVALGKLMSRTAKTAAN